MEERASRITLVIKWLGKGDESSKFYSGVVKSKCQREQMDYLIREDGSEVRDEMLVVTEVQRHYEELYLPQVRSMAEHREM